MYAFLGIMFYLAWIVFMFWVGHRVGAPKNRNWVLWCFFLGWIGVLIMWKGADKSLTPKYDPNTGELIRKYDANTGELLA